jgi:hypothetical protein
MREASLNHTGVTLKIARRYDSQQFLAAFMLRNSGKIPACATSLGMKNLR